MNYRGYAARIERDAASDLLVGHIDGIDDIVGFHAHTPADLEAAFREAVEDYVETLGRVKALDQASRG